MRTITDSTGVEWTVFEVKKQGGSSERWSYLPDEFENGWLCFDSKLGKRRLTPIPPRWRELGDHQVLRLLGEAKPVQRPNLAIEDRPATD